MKNIVQDIKIVLNYIRIRICMMCIHVFFFTRNIKEIIINLNYILNKIVQNCSNYYNTTIL